MAKQEETSPPEREQPEQRQRIPLIFPAGDLDAMIFHEEYAIEHSQR